MQFRNILTLLLAALFAVSCSSARILTPEGERVPGCYRYHISWDCPGPDNSGNMHVDEEGHLRFLPDGTFVDHALQHHYLFLADSSAERYDFDYYCEGEWKASEGKYLMREHAKNFSMKLVGDNSPERLLFADKIFRYYTPRDRWVTYTIERLDRRWFVWSLVYPDGQKMLWPMKRTRQ